MRGIAMAGARLNVRAVALGVALALLGVAGCAQKTDWVEGTLVTVDVTGVWKGRVVPLPNGIAGEFEMTLTQRGARVTGEGRIRTQKIGIEGTVRGDVFTFNEPGGRLRAEARVNGDDLSGEGRTNLIMAGSGQQTPFSFTLAR
jgi:hypothetical protein